MRFVLVHEIGIKSLIQEILINGGLDVLNDVLIKWGSAAVSVSAWLTGRQTLDSENKQTHIQSE